MFYIFKLNTHVNAFKTIPESQALLFFFLL